MARKVLENGGNEEKPVAAELLPDLIDKVPELASARDYGVDVRMLVDNLNRPVIERIKRHQIALNTFEKLHKAKDQGQ